MSRQRKNMGSQNMTTDDLPADRRRRAVPDLHRLEQFVAVVERGSLTEAAADLGVTQQALSVAIRGLEEHVGAQLFARSRGMRPSAAGLRLYESARVLLAGAQRMIPDVQAVANGHPEVLRIGYSPAISSLDVFDVVRDHLPSGARLHLERLFPGALRARLESGGIDVAFRRGVTAAEGLESVVVGFDRLNVAVRSQTALSIAPAELHLQDLSGHPLILWAPESRSSYAAFLLAQCRRVGFEPQVEVSPFQGLDQVAAPLAMGWGYSLVAVDPGAYCGGRVTVRPLLEEIKAPLQAQWLPTSRTGLVGNVTRALAALPRASSTNSGSGVSGHAAEHVL